MELERFREWEGEREGFGTWAAGLDDETFARAIAAVACLPPISGVEPRGDRFTVSAARAAPEGFARARPKRVEALLRDIERGTDVPTDGATHSLRWRSLRGAWLRERDQQRGDPLRIEVIPSSEARTEAGVSAFALLKCLQRANRARGIADSVYVRVDEPRRPVIWEWPIRLRLVDPFGRRELSAAVRDIPWPQLVRLARAKEDESDLLLVDGSLDEALEWLDGSHRRLRTDCVLALRGAGSESPSQAEDLFLRVRSRVTCAGVGAIAIPGGRLGAFLRTLVESLSHDQALDVALGDAWNSASADADESPPMLMLSRELVERARLREFSRDLASTLRKMAPLKETTATQIEELASRIDHIGASGAFASERGEASELMAARAEGEAVLNRPLRDVRATQPDDGARQGLRRVNCRVHPRDARGAEGPPVRTLESAGRYSLVVDIGSALDSAAAASEPLPEGMLPKRKNGHTLDISFIPLVADLKGVLQTPQQAQVWLPPSGRSTEGRFALDTDIRAETYRARLLVSHETRVLQSLLLSADLDSLASTPFSLVTEAATSADLAPDPEDEAFDAAIVVNHSADGVAGLTVLTGTGVQFLQPEGLDDVVNDVRTRLSSNLFFPEPSSGLDAPEAAALLRTLSRLGRAVMQQLPRELDTDLPDGARVQVVEARPGAWLPAEILYRGPALARDAVVCPHIVDALDRANGGSHATCPHRDSAGHLCPMRLWGVSNVIERQPDLGDGSIGEYAVRVRSNGNRTLDPLRRALLGTSVKVRQVDAASEGPIQDALRSATGQFSVANDWAKWVDAVEAEKPSLLLLLPHSDKDPEEETLTALEIGGGLLPIDAFDDEYVTRDAAVAPVVLLLGCSTQLTDTPFLNFVQLFKRHHAAVVVGTLCAMRARRTAPFIADLLRRMHNARGSARTFGQIFLESKRHLLAIGDTFPLGLTMYGDVDWRL